MAANFNNSAWFYDRLSRVVFGKALVNTQLYLLSHIKAGDNILIAGGGTGWVLEEINKLHPSGLSITYVDVAANMIALSKKRETGGNKVIFVNDAIENVNLSLVFDVVLTPFLLDNVTEQTLKTVFNHMHGSLKTNGLWLNTDFQLTGKWWQVFLLKSMFIFFKVVCGIEAGKLPNIKAQFNFKGYTTVQEQTFYNDFIVATIYCKTP